MDDRDHRRRTSGVSEHSAPSLRVLTKPRVNSRKRRTPDWEIIEDLSGHPSAYVTIAQLAKYWVVSRRKIQKEIECGALNAIRLGPRLLRVSTVEALKFERAARMRQKGKTSPPGRRN